MKRLPEIGPIDDLFDWLESLTAEVIAGAYRDDANNVPPVWKKIQALVAEHEAGQTSYDSLYCYIAAAHAMHAASEAVREAGDLEWSRELHLSGQRFLHYATGDINNILAGVRLAMISGVVADGGQSIN